MTVPVHYSNQKIATVSTIVKE